MKYVAVYREKKEPRSWLDILLLRRPDIRKSIWVYQVVGSALVSIALDLEIEDTKYDESVFQVVEEYSGKRPHKTEVELL